MAYLDEFPDPEVRVQFDPADPGKTIPLSWATDLLQRFYAASPARFGNKLAEVVTAWSTGGKG